MSAIRGVGFGLGAAYLYGKVFGFWFGVLSTAGQIIAYQLGIRPTRDYQPAARARIRMWQILAAVNRGVGYGVSGYISAWAAHENANAVGVGQKLGLVIGGITAVSGVFTSAIEWTADHVPEKRMRVFGLALILIGFVLQSLQYWVALFDVPVRS